jgi:hypothetical protein
VPAITYSPQRVFYCAGWFSLWLLAGAVWLPLLLAMIEIIIRKQEEKGPGELLARFHYVVALVLLVLGVQTLAGHVEITYYTLLVSGYYALVQVVDVVVPADERSRYAYSPWLPWLLVMVLFAGWGWVPYN